MSSADQIPQTIEQEHVAGFHESGTVSYCLHCAAARSGDALRGVVAERDQFAAACDIFQGRIQALEMERDALETLAHDNATRAVTAEAKCDELRHEVDDVATERDQLAKDRAGAVDALLVVTAERDAAQAEGARMREALAAARRQMQNEWHNKPRIGMEAECAMADAALSGSPSTAEWLKEHDRALWDKAVATAWHRATEDVRQGFGTLEGHPFTVALAEHDAKLRERVKVLERLLRLTQSLLDDVDQGPRSENSTEWRIPWSRHAVEVFSEIAAALSPTTDGAPKPEKP